MQGEKAARLANPEQAKGAVAYLHFVPTGMARPYCAKQLKDAAANVWGQFGGRLPIV